VANTGARLIISEYRVLWDALIHYESQLEGQSSRATDDDERLLYDEKLQDIAQARKSLKFAARNDFGLTLGE